MMKILLSPTKKQCQKVYSDSQGNPHFINNANELIRELKKLGAAGTQKLLNLSENLSQTNWERIENWSGNPTRETGSTAIYTYTGEAFQYLAPDNFSPHDLYYAQDHLLIFSGLYGFLKPLDLIMPYRLDIKDRLIFSDYKSLYGYWKDLLTSYLEAELKSHHTGFLLDLSSKEYSKGIDFKRISVPVITAEFKTLENGKLKTIPIWSKRMRGLMAHKVIKGRINTIEGLKSILLDDYILEECRDEKLLYIKRGDAITSGPLIDHE